MGRTEERINELRDRSIGLIQSEAQMAKKQTNKKTASVICGTNLGAKGVLERREKNETDKIFEAKKFPNFIRKSNLQFWKLNKP